MAEDDGGAIILLRSIARDRVHDAAERRAHGRPYERLQIDAQMERACLRRRGTLGRRRKMGACVDDAVFAVALAVGADLAGSSSTEVAAGGAVPAVASVAPGAAAASAAPAAVPFDSQETVC